MRCANLLAVADTSDPELARLKELAATRVRHERAYRKALTEERAEAMRLMALDEGPGTVAISQVMGVTREAVRQAYNRWRANHDATADD